MLLLVGLGNPGPKYERNRHNIGYMAVDAIVRRHSFQPERARFQAVCSEGVIAGRKTLAMRPTTFMNDSGRAGHNGLRSIDQHIGPDFWRIRIGIGHPGEKERVHGHVLGDFAKADYPMVERMIDAIVDAAPLIAKSEFNAFMSRVALLIQPPKPKKPPQAEVNEEPDGI